MKKYIVTDKHPELKEGVILSELDISDIYYLANSYEHYVEEDIEKGYIKELLEPEFTKDDMEGLLVFWDQEYLNTNYKGAIEEYLKQKDK